MHLKIFIWHKGDVYMIMVRLFFWYKFSAVTSRGFAFVYLTPEENLLPEWVVPVSGIHPGHCTGTTFSFRNKENSFWGHVNMARLLHIPFTVQRFHCRSTKYNSSYHKTRFLALVSYTKHDSNFTDMNASEGTNYKGLDGEGRGGGVITANIDFLGRIPPKTNPLFLKFL